VSQRHAALSRSPSGKGGCRARRRRAARQTVRRAAALDTRQHATALACGLDGIQQRERPMSEAIIIAAREIAVLIFVVVFLVWAGYRVIRESQR